MSTLLPTTPSPTTIFSPWSQTLLAKPHRGIHQVLANGGSPDPFSTPDSPGAGRHPSQWTNPSPFYGGSPGLTFDSGTIFSSVDDADELAPASWVTDEQEDTQADGLGLSTWHPWNPKSMNDHQELTAFSVGGESTAIYADGSYDKEAIEPDPAFGLEANWGMNYEVPRLLRRLSLYGDEIKPMKLPQDDSKLRTMVKRVSQAMILK
ncbi:hypothetical protein FRB90_000961 [Tulasnella sp. 427]|nr:hypothetical protein FRB90_000961 [Tulasnella sp. 427]